MGFFLVISIHYESLKLKGSKKSKSVDCTSWLFYEHGQMGVVFFKYIDNLSVMRFLLGDGLGGGMLTNNLEGAAKIDPFWFRLDFQRYVKKLNTHLVYKLLGIFPPPKILSSQNPLRYSCATLHRFSLCQFPFSPHSPPCYPGPVSF